MYSNRKYMRIFMHGLVFLLCQTWAKRNKNIKRQNINVAGLVINVGSVKDREMVLVRGRLLILFSYVVPSCSWTQQEPNWSHTQKLTSSNSTHSYLISSIKLHLTHKVRNKTCWGSKNDYFYFPIFSKKWKQIKKVDLS